MYEVQEQDYLAFLKGDEAGWKTVAAIPARGGTTFRVGNDPRAPQVAARAAGRLYSYRVRAINGAGNTSEWSTPSAPQQVGELPDSIFADSVVNYPNPFDSRKENTTISYMLKQDAEVSILIYDLFGFRVWENTYPPGAEGGKYGINSVTWDGSDSSGNKVSKGGYIAVIQYKGDKVISVKRKIGVIH